ncbi:MAG: exodeoxyribonuclease VII small subunit [Mariprofundaceae bacterium]|nr:exodeoxyribonuclease VII small subunit [Mariprofundaceae bacterium]
MSKVQKNVKDHDEIEALSFEGALTELTGLVEQLESGEMSLEDSVSSFEKGVKLSRRCESLLDGAEQRLQILNGNDE